MSLYCIIVLLCAFTVAADLFNTKNLHFILFWQACQHSAFLVANSLSNNTRRRWQWVTNQSITLSTILCLIFGICGYLGFFENTQGDILNNFPLERVCKQMQHEFCWQLVSLVIKIIFLDVAQSSSCVFPVFNIFGQQLTVKCDLGYN